MNRPGAAEQPGRNNHPRRLTTLQLRLLTLFRQTVASFARATPGAPHTVHLVTLPTPAARHAEPAIHRLLALFRALAWELTDLKPGARSRRARKRKSRTKNRILRYSYRPTKRPPKKPV